MDGAPGRRGHRDADRPGVGEAEDARGGGKVVADLKEALLEEARGLPNFALRNRRPELYAELARPLEAPWAFAGQRLGPGLATGARMRGCLTLFGAHPKMPSSLEGS